ncbi:hypothetical protein [Streptomyces sp. NPDC047525]|uniref:hypothetical protein n=1 Tax=Streptomyces sp. NPDC047525 TaxID=3155264 RepID=UPI0033ECC4FE
MTTSDLVGDTIGVLNEVPGRAEQIANWSLSNAWWIAVLALGVGGALGTGRWLLCRSSMAERTALEVLPTTGFDPKVEEVVRFGHQIARAHKSVSRWLFSPPRGTAVRVQFTCSGGALSMRVEGPTKAMSVLRHQGYAQVEMRPVETGANAARDRPQIRLGTQSAT